MSNCLVRILGSGSEATRDKLYLAKVKAGKAERRTSPAVLIRHNKTDILFDCGPDIKEQLEKARGMKPEMVFITHAHPEHIEGIDDLPQDTKRFLKEGAEFDHCRVEAVPVEHSVIAPAVGFIFYTDHLKIAYFPDFLRISEPDKLKGADLALLDGASLKRDIIRGPERNIGHQCFDETTRIATPQGLKSWEQVQVGQEVYCWKRGRSYNKNGGYLATTRVINKFIYDYSGPMVRIKNPHTDLLITPEHRLLVSTKPKVIRRKGPDSPVWMVRRWTTAEEILEWSRKGKSQKPICLPWFIPAPGSCNKKKIDGFLLQDFLRVAGWYFSEGYLGKDYRGRPAKLRIVQTVHKDLVKADLSRLGFPVHETQKGRELFISSRKVAQLIADNFSSDGEKVVPDWLLELPKHQRDNFLQTYLLGDGSKSRKGRFFAAFESSEKRAYEICKVLWKQGLWATIHQGKNVGRGSWRINFLKRPFAIYPRSISLEQYSGKVWCLETQEGNLLVERNGKFAITGNSMLNSIRMAKTLGIKNIVFTHLGNIGANHDWLQTQVIEMAKEEGYQGLVLVARDGLQFEITSRGIILKGEIQETESSITIPANTFGESISHPSTSIEGKKKLIESNLVGLILKPPHGRWIAEGFKTLIVKSVRFQSNLLVPIYVVSKEESDPEDEATVWAKIVLAKPEPISIEEFWKRQGEHRISETEARDWWGVTKTEGPPLYAYKFQFLEGFPDQPYKVVWKKGYQNWIKNLVFIERAPKEIGLKEWKVWPIPVFKIKDKRQLQQARDDFRLLGALSVRLAAGETVRDRETGQEYTWEQAVQSAVNVIKSLVAYEEETGEEGITLHPDRWKPSVRKFYSEVLERLKKEKVPVRIEEAKLSRSEILKIDPLYLLDLRDEELLQLHDDLHDSYEDEAPEELVNAHIFVVGAMDGRGLKHEEIDDDLDEETRRLRVTQLLSTEAPEKMVPLVMTHQAVAFVGSHVYGLTKSPEDLDILVRTIPDHYVIPKLRAWFQALYPDKAVHITPEEKGPTWDFIPLGDFVLLPAGTVPKEIAPVPDPELPDIAAELVPKLKPLLLMPGYLLIDKERKVIIRQDTAGDPGLMLKLITLFPKWSIKSEIEAKAGEPLADLWFIPYEKARKVIINEPEFKAFYGLERGLFPYPEPRSKSEAVEAPPITEPIEKITFGEWFPPIKAGKFGYAGKEVFDVRESWELFGEPMIKKYGFIYMQQKFDCEGDPNIIFNNLAEDSDEE